MRPAVRFRQTQLTYGELDRLSNQLAHTLTGHGIKRGDRVARGLQLNFFGALVEIASEQPRFSGESGGSAMNFSGGE